MLRKQIEHIRRQPEHVRVRYVAMLTGLSGLLVVIVWAVVLLPFQLKHGPGKNRQPVQPVAVVAESAAPQGAAATLPTQQPGVAGAVIGSPSAVSASPEGLPLSDGPPADEPAPATTPTPSAATGSETETVVE